MTPSPFHLANRDLWIFGGAGYLGRPVVTLLSSLGANVVCVDLEDHAEQAAKSAGWGPEVTRATLNIEEAAAIPSFIEDQIQRRGIPEGVAILTYASTAKRLEDVTPDDFDKANHGNLTATFTLARAVAEPMAERGRGSIVLFSSMYGAVAPDPAAYEAPMNPNPIEYGVGKAGLLQMSRYLAIHYGPRGVRCNCISPGPFPNPTVQSTHPEFTARLASKVPLARVGEANEIAAPVAFLLSDASTFITGHNLAVDGGWTAW